MKRFNQTLTLISCITLFCLALAGGCNYGGGDEETPTPDQGVPQTDGMVITPDQGVPQTDGMVITPDQGVPTGPICGDGTCDDGECGQCPTDCGKVSVLTLKSGWIFKGLKSTTTDSAGFPASTPGNVWGDLGTELQWCPMVETVAFNVQAVPAKASSPSYVVGGDAMGSTWCKNISTKYPLGDVFVAAQPAGYGCQIACSLDGYPNWLCPKL